MFLQLDGCETNKAALLKSCRVRGELACFVAFIVLPNDKSARRPGPQHNDSEHTNDPDVDNQINKSLQAGSSRETPVGELKLDV
ncbi:unnamed protein product [Heligmosomoides polygyrus]|uniref:Uncharacterized protein n=1 Tax=Heligmosomoides polygyrus TaxID=6339 RepID=A0A183FJX2_HELPZ|nr:unnamed protein product [Heligmosomoides polygyrus]